MIPAAPVSMQHATVPPRWQQLWREAVRDPRELLSLLGLAHLAGQLSENAATQFPLRVPRGFVDRMRHGDPHDPLLRQVLPLDDEDRIVPGFGLDAVGDAAARRGGGLIHKYRGRALLVATGSCAVHCRYCFRRHFPYEEAPRSLADWRPALDEIADDTTLQEVILSGGDPLTLVDETLLKLIEGLTDIPHLRRLRIHTRLPIVITERVTQALVDILRNCRLTPIMVVHSNHANELDSHVAAALAKFSNAGIVLLNQAVLLAGINDSVQAQKALCERLVDLRVIPYYLHQLDRVTGATHFEVPIATGRQIIRELREHLPGYAVPRYVAEIPGELSKSIIE